MQKEELLLSLLRSGELEIDTEGRIWLIAKRNGGLRGPNGEYLKGSRIYPYKRVRAEYPDRQGYLSVAVLIDGERIAAGAHRLVWTHFNGPIPEGLTINHKNGIKPDNRPENLEVATYSQQRRHALEVLNVRRLRASGMMIKDIAMIYEMKPKAISAICTRRTWPHI